jgi:class 3 adenylate cyclase
MANLSLKIPIGIKIFGIASSLLTFLLIVVYISYDHIKRVNNELIDIAEYMTKLTAHSANIDMHVLEQEIHLERMLRFYETEPLDPKKIQIELDAFEQRNELVDREIAEAIALSQKAVKQAKITQDIIEFARLEPMFQELGEEHQEFHEHALKIINLLSGEERSPLTPLKKGGTGTDGGQLKISSFDSPQIGGVGGAGTGSIANFLAEKIAGESAEIQAQVNFLLDDLKDYETYIKSELEWYLQLEPGDLDEMSLLEASEPEESHLMKLPILETILIEEERDFNQKLEGILEELAKFTERSAIAAEEHEQRIIRLNWMLTSSATIFGLLYASIITLGLVKPVKKLLGGTLAVEQGNLDIRVAIQSRDEIETLAEAFNAMVEEVQEKERIKATFGQYVDPRIVENLIAQTSTGQETGNKQMMTVFFSDVAGFSTISELLTASGLVNLINQYLTLASEPIAHYQGVIDKFIGDAVTAFWGPPFVSEADHAKLACFAALDQFKQLEKLRQMMPELMGFRKGLPDVNIRIGLASSELVAGNIGSEQFQSYTVIGEAVHLAEELESTNKQYGTKILILSETKQLAGDAIATREIDWLYLGDRSQPVPVYELLARSEELDPTIAQLRDRFEAGLNAYRHRQWSEAISNFQACLEIQPDDRPSQVYLQRIQQLSETPPPQDWDGVWVNNFEIK